ncbi:ribokinase [Parapedobacter indicus]|uniref:Ribokinase n=1 Tax=Parapedobacter indicus TaxID=1477437 RepID=A0A1I3S6D3_9SPHI|nr:ribokinase [Parapedobacter indicus]PPK99874.1 ribokinase [Parapedobacter indicus]SFJ53159.1 ribokinase [Parapedobacter indicus]
MSNKIIVVGSMNMDMVVKTSHIPQPGETVLGGSFLMNPGGKGANQAVAVARLGGDVTFIGKIGDDIFGKQSSQLFDEEGVDTNGILADDNSPSGIALITVDERGENSIVVAPGANAHLEPNDVEEVLDNYPDSKILLVQLEIPMRTVEHAARIARRRGMQVILNPAPANSLVPSMFNLIDIITPNVNEAEMLSGVRISDVPSARQAAESIHQQGVKHVIVTLGKDGAALLEEGIFYHIPTPSVETVDTTAAGDVFNGALAVAVSEGKALKDAVSFACRAASIAVTRMGAQSSIPFRNEVLLNSMT